VVQALHSPLLKTTCHYKNNQLSSASVSGGLWTQGKPLIFFNCPTTPTNQKLLTGSPANTLIKDLGPITTLLVPESVTTGAPVSPIYRRERGLVIIGDKTFKLQSMESWKVIQADPGVYEDLLRMRLWL